MPPDDIDIYDDLTAANLCRVAMRDGRCADLLNVLSHGGAATLQPTTTGGVVLALAARQMLASLMGDD